MAASTLPEGRYADVGDGLRLHYHEAGQGPAVLFVHGSGPGASGWSNFRANMEAFAAGGFRALVPDLLGYGHSSKPEGFRYAFDLHVELLARLLDAADVERASLVGNSMGGALSIAFALRWPERVDRLVLMAPGGIEPREVYMEMRGIRRMLRALYGPEGLTLEGMRKVFELQLHDASRLDEATLADRFAIAQTQPREVFSTVEVPNLEDRLGELAMPVLGFWGMDDQFCPPSGATKLAERVPDARVVLVTRCGHWVMVEHPALFDRTTLAFLRGELA